MAANEVLARVADVASSDLLAFNDVDEQGGVKVAEGPPTFWHQGNVGGHFRLTTSKIAQTWTALSVQAIMNFGP